MTYAPTDPPITIPEPDSFWTLAGMPEYVALDLETTGLEPSTDEIIEVGAVRFRDGVEVERYSKLVKPRLKHLPEEITALTGITDADLKDAPSFKKIADEFIAFIGDAPIVGHNLPFDLGFLTAHPAGSDAFHGSRAIPRSHDTNLTARFLLPCLDAYGLASLSRAFELTEEPNHRAVADAAATGQLFALLMKGLRSVPKAHLEEAFHFVEGTSSPLANTLRATLRALRAGFKPTEPPPSALTGPYQNRANVLKVSGEARPTIDITTEHIQRLYFECGRFETVLKDYEVRPQQVGMAIEVMRVLQEGGALVVEAGTGVGKSMGYLIPSLLSGKRVIVSTRTKNLQDQLFYDEIPRLSKLFKFGFSAALLKGRHNYLCNSKWRNWTLYPERGGVSAKMREAAALTTRWAKETQTGDISELNAVHEREGMFHSLIASESGYCMGPRCPFGRGCFLQRIRLKAQEADLVIVNHSLILSDLGNEASLLGENVERFVIDEAHHLEEVATDNFSMEASAYQISQTLERLTQLVKRKGALWNALQADNRLRRLVEPLEKIGADAGELGVDMEKFFQSIAWGLREKIPAEMAYSISFRFRAGEGLHQLIAGEGQAAAQQFLGLGQSLSKIRERIEVETEEPLPSEAGQELLAVSDEMGMASVQFQEIVKAEDVNRVYWVEIVADQNRTLQLKSAPLDLSEMLNEGLWTRVKTVILTSATLAAGGGEDAFGLLTRSLGLSLLPPEKLRTIVYGSPFDYQKNCRVVFARGLPAPPDQSAEHLAAITEICGKVALQTQRGMLILLTSYFALKSMERQLSRMLQGSGIEILAQQSRSGRDRLIRQFRQAQGKAILLGTDSLWEGIDVPGEALEIVVIPKLPFAVPDDPIVAARIEKLREAGRNPFNEFQLPAAILRMRQGSGRLIRTITDRGVVLVGDPRVVTKYYGRAVRSALQGKAYSPDGVEETVTAVVEFFEKGNPE